MEVCKVLGRQADGVQFFFGTAYGALPPLFVKVIKDLLRVGDVLNAVGRTLDDGAVVPCTVNRGARCEVLLEKERPETAEVCGQLLCGGSSVGSRTEPRTTILRQLRLEDISQP